MRSVNDTRVNPRCTVLSVKPTWKRVIGLSLVYAKGEKKSFRRVYRTMTRRYDRSRSELFLSYEP